MLSDPLETALARFPPNSPLVDLLRDLASPDVDRRTEAYERVRNLDPFDSWQDARTPSWTLTVLEADALMHALQEVEFPLPPKGIDWKDGLHDVVFCLLRSPHSHLPGVIERVYPRMQSGKRRCALLALLGTIATREAAEAFVSCIRTHGWPEHPYGRVFEELQKLFAFGDVLLPDVLLTAEPKALPYIGDALLGALSSGAFRTEDVGGRLDALGPYIVASLRKLLKSTAKAQDKPGIAWRFDEKYHYKRHQTCMFLDLAGYLRSPKLAPLLEEALAYADPRIVAFAVLSRMRRGEPVPPEALEKAAACHETRSILHAGMSSLGRLVDFPPQFCTWEAFGAAAMVDWLLYPTELGQEPDEILLEQTVWLDEPPTQAMHVWKFRVGDEPWKAGVSGPYALLGDPQSVHGSLTFSRFDDWESATPEQHLEQCAGTVESIREQS